MKILSNKKFAEQLSQAYQEGIRHASVPFMGGCPKCGRTNGTDEEIAKRKYQAWLSWVADDLDNRWMSTFPVWLDKGGE